METSPVVDDPRTDSTPKLSASEQLLTHWQGVYLLTLRITDDAHAAEDIVQEAYVKALERVAKDRPANPRTWLFSIAANLARNWIRDRSTHRRLEKTMAYEKAAEFTSPQPDEAVLALRKHFKALDEKYRTALSMHYEQGLTYREVAAVLQKPEGTAASLITRGVELLRQSLAGEGHTIAPAIVAMELQRWGASAAARPELFAALKSALAAKSIASGASAVAASKAGATVLTGKVAAAGVLLSLACVFVVTHFTVPRPAAAPTVLPIAPVAPVKGAVPADTPKLASFDSGLRFLIQTMSDDGRFESIGETPAMTEAGIRVPTDDSWLLSPQGNGVPVKQVLAEVRSSGAPGLNLSDSSKPLTPDEVADLIALPHLKTLVVSHEVIDVKDIPKLQQMKSLERLSIYYGGKLDGADIAPIATLPNLRVLLTHSPISDSAVTELLKLEKLQTLGGGVSPEALARLASLPALANLDVRGSEVLDIHILANPAILPKSLKTLSLGLAAEKLQKFAQLRALLPHVRVNGWNALADEPAGQKSPADDEKDALVAVDHFAHDANFKLPDADPEVASVLSNRRITAEWRDTPLAQVLAILADHTDIRIVLDPALPNSNALPNVNLRISDMSSTLALSWVLKLADLSEITIGHTVVIGTSEKFGHIVEPAPIEYALAVSPGEQPWTQAETEALAGIVNTWSSESVRLAMDTRRFMYSFASMSTEPPCRVLAPGKIQMGSLEPQLFETLAEDFERIPPRVVVPRWIPSLLHHVDEPLTLPPPLKRATIGGAVSLLNKAVPGLNLLIDPKLQAAGIDNVLAPNGWPGNNPSTEDAIMALCNEARCTLSLVDNALFMTRSSSPIGLYYPVILDLRPALKAGADERKLSAVLAEVAKQGNGIAPVAIRGRWVAASDPVTARRAMAVLDEAAKIGKVPALPAAPWYFELAKNAELQLPKPPKAHDEYDGNGY